MKSLTHSGRWFGLKALAWAVGIAVLAGVSASADDGACAICGNQVAKDGTSHHHHGKGGSGTLGYGPPGLFPGFQGFGLGFCKGYGYGGHGLGVGVEGGFPFYAGPGYPTCFEPPLRRLHHIVPFPYFGGTGFPTPDHPNYFGGTGPLVADQPVVTIVGDRGVVDHAGGYGGFHGSLPYPEATFAPYTDAAAAMGASGGVTSPAPPAPRVPSATPPQPEASAAPARGPALGIDTELVADARGLKVSRVSSGTAAAKAGLRSGDVIQSMNGYVTRQPGNVTWIIANAAPDHVLTMDVRAANGGKSRTITAKLP